MNKRGQEAIKKLLDERERHERKMLMEYEKTENNLVEL